MEIQSGERLLKQERVHPGIFGLPVLALIATSIPALLLFFLFHQMGKMMGQLVPPNSPPPFVFGWVWIMPATLLFLPSLVMLLFASLAYWKSEITLTSKRVVYRTGFLVRASGELSLENVDSIFLVEPLLGRLFGYGTVIVSSLGGARFSLFFIGKPQIFHATLQKATAEAKAVRRTPPKTTPGPHDESRYMPRG